MARLGLVDGWECAWANDLDPTKNRIYAHNFGADHLDRRDVHEVAADVAAGRLQNRADPEIPAFPTDCGLAWASFPCQDLSLAGDRGGMSARRSGSYWPFWHIMRDLRSRSTRNEVQGPRLIVVENVVGLLSDTASFNALCQSFADLDMQFGAMKLDAADFLPQSRPRVFVVAVDGDTPVDGLTGTDASTLPGNQGAVVKAFSRLPTSLQSRWRWWSVPEPTREVAPFSTFFEPAPTDIEYNTEVQTDYLLSLMNERHLAKVRAAQASGQAQFGFLYRRTRAGQQRAEVRFDGVAGCLRTSRGGSSRQTLMAVQGEYVRTRLLSRLEQARLMGISLNADGRLPGSAHEFFPPGLRFNEAWDAMGDGVAVPVVAWLDRHLLTPLADRLKLQASVPSQSGLGARPKSSSISSRPVSA